MTENTSKPGKDLAEKRRYNPLREQLWEMGLYHSFRLPDGRELRGIMGLEQQYERLRHLQVPDDLRGKRILDIGPWDGFYTFEMERRGADVTAVDYVDLDTFRALHRAFGSRAEYHQLDVYELSPEKLGTFDIVLCLGVLYHLKHPLLGLEKVCSVTRDVCLIDTFVSDGEAWLSGTQSALPWMEFYERDELGGQLDNWCGPTVSAVEAMVRSAGFAACDVMHVEVRRGSFAARRRWRNLPQDEEPAVHISGLNSHSHRGRSFRSSKEEYIGFWCPWSSGEAPPIDSVFPEIDRLGTAPVWCSLTGEGLLIQTRVPPGLSPGRHIARVKIGRAAWSNEVEFFTDLPDTGDKLSVALVQDGMTWTAEKVSWESGGWLTIWADGLTNEADPGNISVLISGIPHSPHAVHADRGQINVKLRPVIHSGVHQLQILHRGGSSEVLTFEVQGQAPAIRGLEALALE